MQIDSYAVPCDRCAAKGFIEGLLCPKCSGDRSVLITERTSEMAKQWYTGALIVFVLAGVIGLLWATHP